LVRLRFQRKGSPRISHTLWIARYVSVEADGVVIGDDDHSDRARRTCDMRRFSPDELVTLRLGLIKLRAAKIWLVCARPPTRAAQKVASSIPGSKRHNASVPVGLHPRVAPAAQVDLQELGLPPTGCAEKDRHAARLRRGHRGETGQASWLIGCRVHVSGCGVATDPGPGRPDPQLPAPRS